MAEISGKKRLCLWLLPLILVALAPTACGAAAEGAGGTGNNESSAAKGPAEVVAAGIWIAPGGGWDNVTGEVEETLRSLSGPSRVLRIMVQEEEVIELGYIGTSDGILVLWPDVTETLQMIAPFDYRERPWYLEAARAGETVWTKPYQSQTTGNISITCATPILIEGNLSGVVGMDVSLAEIEVDLANISSGYPFLLDGQGAVVMKSPLPEGFLWDEILAPGSLLDSKNLELAELAEEMVRGEEGMDLVRLEKGSTRIVYSPLPSVGWSLGVASGDGELTAAKAAAYDQLFHCISGHTEIMALETGEALKGRGSATGIALPGLGDGDGDGEGPSWPMAIAAAAIFALMGGLVGYWSGRNAFGPIFEAIAKGLEEIGRGDLNAKIEGDGPRVVRRLGEAFDKMAIDLKDRISLFEERSLEAGRSEKAEEVMEELQRFLLPERVPQIEGFQVAILALAEERECCHFYDAFEMEGGKAMVVLAEVSGKGLSAAMVAAVTRSHIRAASRKLGDPAKALRETNQNLVGNVRNGMVVSCFCGMLDLSSHAMSYANAGHIPPFIVSSDGFVDTLVGGAIAMGALDHIDLEMEGWMIDPGDVLVIYNDGLIEVENDGGERFGTESLITLVKDNRERSAQDIVKELERAIRDHMGGDGGRPDAAAMIVKRAG